MKKIINKYTIFAIAVIVLIAIDQITKGIVYCNIKDESIEIIKNVLSLTYVENTGGAFGIGYNSTFTYIISNLIVLGIIIRFMIIQRKMIDLKTNVALLLILAGGIGNLLDRVLRGFVIDFISICPQISLPKFNIADIYITCGWIFFIWIIAVYTTKEFENMKRKI